MRWKSQLLLAFFIAISAMLPISAQSDDWYQNHDHIFNNRWEGLFGEDQGSPEWELRSFVGNVEPYPMGKNVDLTVAYYVPDLTKAFNQGDDISRGSLLPDGAEAGGVKEKGRLVVLRGLVD